MKRILGIDYGEVRVGLSLSDLTQTIAQPFKTIMYKNINNLLDQLKEIIIENEVEKLVVGIPYNMKGEDTKQTLKVKEFISFLESNLSYDIELIDERLSSIEAEKTMHKMNVKTGHNKSNIDKIAASVILQEYLDSDHD
ncbi:MAG: Holliday junction resolvase RuvX [Candidatus Marinimicrobia bacterium]|nr:Holliday junction resolvase RuvX [Candidatus Neomarinimicrobiota bacterium]